MGVVTKISAKGQTIVPREIRALLDLQPGDLIAWEPMANGCVRLRRVQPLDVEYLGAMDSTLSEWGSGADEDAYRDL
jgi:antitoxin PrlF